MYASVAVKGLVDKMLSTLAFENWYECFEKWHVKNPNEQQDLTAKNIYHWIDVLFLSAFIQGLCKMHVYEEGNDRQKI